MSAILDAITKATDELWPLYDVDKSGELDREEFAPFCLDVLKAHFISPASNSKEWMDNAFKVWDRDGSGTISSSEADEFLKICFIIHVVESKWAALGKGLEEALSKRQFRVFARECLNAMGFPSDWMVAELNVLGAMYDFDGDGEIDKTEAAAFLNDFIGTNLAYPDEIQQEGPWEL